VTESRRTGRKDFPDHKGKITIQNAVAAHHRNGKQMKNLMQICLRQA
jgi:hypothetical protein